MLVGQNIGPFAVEKEIGAGAMGAVYLGRYTKTGMRVAIKVILNGMDSDSKALARFERETEILKKLKHPNIVRLYASGKVKGKPFYAMEFIEGETLDNALQRRGRYTWEEVVRLGQQVCEALQHAHEQGIVHRDLKPANIMVTADGTAKLTDFGIAKGMHVEKLTATNCTVGTATYMSPEQCRGERNLTGKSDIYSLGVVFYELLIGKPPFVTETLLDMFMAHAEGTFERPTRRVLEIPIFLDTLVCQMLEKDPAKRPLDAKTVGQSLTRIMEKVQVQSSAGVDLVSSREVQRLKATIKDSEEDKETARILKAAVSKKKLKKSGKKFYQTGWFQVVGLSVLLLGLAGTIYFVTRPTSPEELHRKAKALWSQKNEDAWYQAQDGPITEYLTHYGNRDDRSTQDIKNWNLDCKIALVWRQLHKSAVTSTNPNAKEAVRLESEGDLVAARDKWLTLVTVPEVYGPLAEKRLTELKPLVEMTSLAKRAEAFGDIPRAIECLEGAIRKSKEENRDRPWYFEQTPWVTHCETKINELKKKAPQSATVKQDRQTLIQQKLDDLNKPENNPKIRQVCEDVIALYEKDSDLAEQVRTAMDLLKQLASKENTPNP